MDTREDSGDDGVCRFDITLDCQGAGRRVYLAVV